MTRAPLDDAYVRLQAPVPPGWVSLPLDIEPDSWARADVERAAVGVQPIATSVGLDIAARLLGLAARRAHYLWSGDVAAPVSMAFQPDPLGSVLAVLDAAVFPLEDLPVSPDRVLGLGSDHGGIIGTVEASELDLPAGPAVRYRGRLAASPDAVDPSTEQVAEAIAVIITPRRSPRLRPGGGPVARSHARRRDRRGGRPDRRRAPTGLSAVSVAYRLLAPEGWDRIPLDDRTERAVARILDRQFRGIDDAPHVRAELREALLTQASEAAAVGGREMFVSSLMVGPLPLQSTLLVSELAGDPAVDDDEVLAELAVLLREDGVGVESCVLAEHPAGRALRRVRVEATAEAADHDTLVIEWYLVAPGGDTIVLLTFSTLLLPIREAFEALFDAVAVSLRWRARVDAARSGEEPGTAS